MKRLVVGRDPALANAGAARTTANDTAAGRWLEIRDPDAAGDGAGAARSMIGVAQNDAGIEEPAVRACALPRLRTGTSAAAAFSIVPDHTRTAPIDLLFRILHDLMADDAACFDVLIALGTHPPMTDDGINERLGITGHERRSRYARTRFMNHRWNDPGSSSRSGRSPSPKSRHSPRTACANGST